MLARKPLHLIALRHWHLLLLALAAGCGHHNKFNFEPVTDSIYASIKKDAGIEVIHSLDSLRNSDPQNGELLLRFYQCKKEYYYRRENTNTNNLYVDSIIYTLEQYKLKDKYPAVYADALNNKGNMFFEAGDLKTAFEYYYKARVSVVMTGDTCLLADQSYHLGMVCYRQEKYTDAISHFRSSLAETKACKDANTIFYRSCELMTNVALAQGHLGLHDSALAAYRSLELFLDTSNKKFGDPNIGKFVTVAHAVAWGNIAGVFVAQKKYDSAEQLLRRSIAVNTQTAFDNRDALYTSMKLAELYHTDGKPDSMLAVLATMRRPMDSIKDEAIALRWNSLMYDHYKQRGQWKEAVATMDEYQRHKELADRKATSLKQTDYAQVMQNQEKEYQLSILRKNNEVANTYLIAAALFIVVVLVAIILILYYYRQTRRNVKQLRSLNERINEQNKKLASTMNELVLSNNEKDRILHVVAHDLRSPVSAITMIAELVVEDMLAGEQQDLVKLIITSCQSQLTLINELMARSGKGDERLNVVKERFDVNDIVNNCVTLLRFRAQEKHQEILYQPADKPAIITADKEGIVRVVNNLITNAVKFSPENEKVEVKVAVRNDKVTLSVTDNGIGIPEKSRSTIFDAFSAAKRPGTAGERSFGLGLSISRQIVLNNNGNIWFESEEDKGSTFYMSLPLQ